MVPHCDASSSDASVDCGVMAESGCGVDMSAMSWYWLDSLCGACWSVGSHYIVPSYLDVVVSVIMSVLAVAYVLGSHIGVGDYSALWVPHSDDFEGNGAESHADCFCD